MNPEGGAVITTRVPLAPVTPGNLCRGPLAAGMQIPAVVLPGGVLCRLSPEVVALSTHVPGQPVYRFPDDNGGHEIPSGVGALVACVRVNAAGVPDPAGPVALTLKASWCSTPWDSLTSAEVAPPLVSLADELRSLEKRSLDLALSSGVIPRALGRPSKKKRVSSDHEASAFSAPR